MIDLSTTYLGLKLKNPLVASASPLSEKLDSVRHLEECGVSAIVMYSLFEEQVIRESLELDRFLSHGTHTYAEALTYLPEVGRYSLGPEAYVENVYRLKQATQIPIIGSLNGVSTGGWIEYAQQIEGAGADAIELNIYYLPVDPDLTGAELEDNYVTSGKRPARQDQDTAVGEAQPVLHLHPQYGAPAGGSRGRWVGALQPLLPT
jgi:dihydroorotate dehydrogenase (fumarate)